MPQSCGSVATPSRTRMCVAPTCHARGVADVRKVPAQMLASPGVCPGVVTGCTGYHQLHVWSLAQVGMLHVDMPICCMLQAAHKCCVAPYLSQVSKLSRLGHVPVLDHLSIHAKHKYVRCLSHILHSAPKRHCRVPMIGCFHQSTRCRALAWVDGWVDGYVVCVCVLGQGLGFRV